MPLWSNRVVPLLECIPRTVGGEEPPEEVSDHRRRQDGDRRGAVPAGPRTRPIQDHLGGAK